MAVKLYKLCAKREKGRKPVNLLITKESTHENKELILELNKVIFDQSYLLDKYADDDIREELAHLLFLIAHFGTGNITNEVMDIWLKGKQMDLELLYKYNILEKRFGKYKMNEPIKVNSSILLRTKRLTDINVLTDNKSLVKNRHLVARYYLDLVMNNEIVYNEAIDDTVEVVNRHASDSRHTDLFITSKWYFDESQLIERSRISQYMDIDLTSNLTDLAFVRDDVNLFLLLTCLDTVEKRRKNSQVVLTYSDIVPALNLFKIKIPELRKLDILSNVSSKDKLVFSPSFTQKINKLDVKINRRNLIKSLSKQWIIQMTHGLVRSGLTLPSIFNALIKSVKLDSYRRNITFTTMFIVLTYGDFISHKVGDTITRSINRFTVKFRETDHIYEMGEVLSIPLDDINVAKRYIEKHIERFDCRDIGALDHINALDVTSDLVLA